VSSVHRKVAMCCHGSLRLQRLVPSQNIWEGNTRFLWTIRHLSRAGGSGRKKKINLRHDS
jgi:hypothetical protein